MPMNKPHLEFHKVDMNAGWVTPPGYPPGIYTTSPFVHDHWEEVYLVSGDLIVGNDAEGKGGEPFDAPTYACRPPGVHHGPFKSEKGCVLYEIHYYDESKK